jgi:hypothetical protein
MLKRKAPKRDKSMEDQIRRDLSFLFDDHSAIVSSNTIEQFGISEVIVAVGNLDFLFRYNRRDDECEILSGPHDGHGIWEFLHVALAAATGEPVNTLYAPLSCVANSSGTRYTGLTWLASILKPRFAALNTAFAPENYPATHTQMVEIEWSIHPR